MKHTTFRVLGLKWKIRHKSGDDPALHRELRGCAQYTPSTVTLDSSMKKERWQETLFHELFHVADNESGKENLTEEQTARVARSLWSILRDNSHLIKLCGLGKD